MRLRQGMHAADELERAENAGAGTRRVSHLCVAMKMLDNDAQLGSS
jgi:hypothetical protein